MTCLGVEKKHKLITFSLSFNDTFIIVQLDVVIIGLLRSVTSVKAA